MSEKLTLYVDCCSHGELTLDLNESTVNRGLTRFKGKFQEAEAINKNRRRYPYKVLDENVKKLNSTIKSRGLVGELDHPTDSIIHFEKASHVITKLWWEGNNLMGEGEILNTPHGKILKSLLSDGVRIGISSRGVGNGRTDENGVLEISESYKLITFDAVADPSTYAAFQEKVADEDTREAVNPNNYTKNFTKNEGSSIYKINKDVLITYLGGIIKEQTRKS